MGKEEMKEFFEGTGGTGITAGGNGLQYFIDMIFFFPVPGSGQCTKRKPCEESEYINAYSSCSSNKVRFTCASILFYSLPTAARVIKITPCLVQLVKSRVPGTRDALKLPSRLSENIRS